MRLQGEKCISFFFFVVFFKMLFSFVSFDSIHSHSRTWVAFGIVILNVLSSSLTTSCTTLLIWRKFVVWHRRPTDRLLFFDFNFQQNSIVISFVQKKKGGKTVKIVCARASSTSFLFSIYFVLLFFSHCSIFQWDNERTVKWKEILGFRHSLRSDKTQQTVYMPTKEQNQWEKKTKKKNSNYLLVRSSKWLLSEFQLSNQQI